MSVGCVSRSVPVPRFVVALPARDEAGRLEACLRALAVQRDGSCDHVVLVLNNCTDDSLGVVERLRPSLGLPLTVATRQFPPSEATAGQARSHALALAAQIAGTHGIIATTDADGVVAPDWIAANQAAFALGAEVVCGRALIDPVEALRISPALHEDDAREVAYGALLDEIHARVDPDPADPLPRHCEQSGASIATTVAAFNRAGGLPPLPIGEDRGFLRALRAVDARVRHAPDVLVTVSGRLQGRAAGGMADTMARRMVLQDALLDGDLEPALICLRRARLRARTQALWTQRHQPDPCWREQVGVLAGCAILPSEQVASWMQSAYCGRAWARIESESPALTRVAVPRQALEQQVSAARRILAELASQPCPASVGSPQGLCP